MGRKTRRQLEKKENFIELRKKRRKGDDTVERDLNIMNEVVLIDTERLDYEPLEESDAAELMNEFYKGVTDYELEKWICQICAVYCSVPYELDETLCVESEISEIFVDNCVVPYNGGCVDCCESCFKHIEKLKTIPDSSIETVPLIRCSDFENLPKLRRIEQIILSPHSTNTFVVRYSPHMKSNHGVGWSYKGSVYSFLKADAQGVLNEKLFLPRRIDELSDNIVVSFIYSDTLKADLKKAMANAKSFQVRTNVIKQWCEFLAKRNSNVVFSEENLATYEDGHIPGAILETKKYDDNDIDVIRRYEVQDSEGYTGNMSSASIDDENEYVTESVIFESPKITEDEKIRANLAIPRSSQFASDFEKSFWKNEFCDIFYDGNFNIPQDMSIKKWLKLLLSRVDGDKIFGNHPSFVFTAHGILRKHDVIENVRYSVKASDKEINEVTIERIEAALLNLKEGRAVDDSAIMKLFKKQFQIKLGVAETSSRLNQFRSGLLWGSMVMFGPSNLFVTINPAESHSQLVVYYNNRTYDLTSNCQKGYPEAWRRASIAARDSVSVNRAFHTFFSSILKYLFQFEVCGNSSSGKGVFGIIRSYDFNLEVNQRHAGPHAHGLVNSNVLDFRLIEKKLIECQTGEFQSKLKLLLESFISDCVPERSEMELVALKEKNVNYLFDIDAADLTWRSKFEERYQRCIEDSQMHKHTHTCEKGKKKGECRLNYPREICEFDLAYDPLHVTLARNHPDVVGHSKILLSATGVNNAVYLVGSDARVKNIVYYITDYISKNPLSFYSMLTLFKESLERFENYNGIYKDELDKTRKLLMRFIQSSEGGVLMSKYECARTIMGFPSSYHSHKQVPLNVSVFVKAFRKRFENVSGMECDAIRLQSGNMFVEYVVQDYLLCNKQLKHLSVYQFHMLYRKISKTSILSLGYTTDDVFNFKSSHKQYGSHVLVRRKQYVVPYFINNTFPMKPSGNASDKEVSEYRDHVFALFVPWDVKHSGNYNVESIDTPWVCQVLDNIDFILKCRKEAYAPKTKIQNALIKSVTDGIMLDSEPSAEAHNIECLDALLYCMKSSADEVENVSHIPKKYSSFISDALSVFKCRKDTTLLNKSVDLSCGSKRINDVAISFYDMESADGIVYSNIKEMDDLLDSHLRGMEYQQQHYKSEIATEELPMPEVDFTFARPAAELPSFNGKIDWNIRNCYLTVNEGIELFKLNKDQSFFYRVFICHMAFIGKVFGMCDRIFIDCVERYAGLFDLEEHFLAFVEGQPGVGKTYVIFAVVWTLLQYGKHDMIRLMSYTGRAALNMNSPVLKARTTCHYARIRIAGGGKLEGIKSEKAYAEIADDFSNAKYMFVDECSFISLDHLWELHSQISTGIGRVDCIQGTKYFGGIHVILVGDLFQLIQSPALYTQIDGIDSDVSCSLEFSEKVLHGRRLFKAFKTVIKLETPMRYKNNEGGLKIWELQKKLRSNSMAVDDIRYINSLSLNESDTALLQNDEDWADPKLIISRHLLGREVNEIECRRRCLNSGETLFVWRNFDSYTANKVEVDGTIKFIIETLPSSKCRKTMTIGMFYCGMPYSHTGNKYMNCDLANNVLVHGSRVILDPREPPLNIHEGICKLAFPPRAIMAKLEGSQQQFIREALPGELIFQLRSHSFELIIDRIQKMKKKLGIPEFPLKIKRMAHELIPQFYGTEFFCQGLTFKGKGIVDLRPPPEGDTFTNLLSLWMVALTRFTSIDDVRLFASLFNDTADDAEIELFLQKLVPKPDLLVETSRLNSLAVEFKEKNRHLQ